MPYRSAKQRAFLHAVHPDIAARWDRKYGGQIVKDSRGDTFTPGARRDSRGDVIRPGASTDSAGDRLRGKKKHTKKAVKQAMTETIPAKHKGQKPITFRKGGLHQSLGVPMGMPIPMAKMQEAMSGAKGPKAQKQARFAKSLKKMRSK